MEEVRPLTYPEKKWIVYQNAQKMLSSRGFEIPEDIDIREMPIDEAKVEIPTMHVYLPREGHPILTTRSPGGIVVYVSDQEDGSDIEVTTIRTVIAAVEKLRLGEGGPDEAIYIIPTKLSTQSREKFQNLQDAKHMIWTLFTFGELLFNLPDHKSVPKHFLLTDQEKKLVSRDYKLKSLQLLLHTDPVAKYYGLRKRDVVKIIRTEYTGMPGLMYRIVK